MGASLRGLLLENMQQGLTGNRRETMAARSNDLPLKAGFDVLPLDTGSCNGLAGFWIGCSKMAGGALGENHAKAKSRIGWIAFKDIHLMLRIGKFDQASKEQPGRTAAKTGNSHSTLSPFWLS